VVTPFCFDSVVCQKNFALCGIEPSRDSTLCHIEQSCDSALCRIAPSSDSPLRRIAWSFTTKIYLQLRAMPSSVKFRAKILLPTSCSAAQRGVNSMLCPIALSCDSALCGIARRRFLSSNQITQKIHIYMQKRDWGLASLELLHLHTLSASLHEPVRLSCSLSYFPQPSKLFSSWLKLSQEKILIFYYYFHRTGFNHF
jgi:hypothetical protein